MTLYVQGYNNTDTPPPPLYQIVGHGPPFPTSVTVLFVMYLRNGRNI